MPEVMVFKPIAELNLETGALWGSGLDIGNSPLLMYLIWFGVINLDVMDKGFNGPCWEICGLFEWIPIIMWLKAEIRKLTF